MNLFSPKHTLIIGTLERLSGCALIDGATRNDDGTLHLDYEGTTDVYWDDQKSATRNGERLFVDDNGDIFRESELALVDG